MTYTIIPDADLETNDVFDQTLARALRDNQVALAEGDATVPDADKLQPRAFRDSVAGDWVVFDHTQGESMGTSYAKAFASVIPHAGAVRAKATIAPTAYNALSGPTTLYIQLYKYSAATTLTTGIGTEHAYTFNPAGGDITTSFEQDLTLEAGDRLEVHAKVGNTAVVSVADVGLLIKVGVPICYAYEDA
jgi:hypothetical protein